MIYVIFAEVFFKDMLLFSINAKKWKLSANFQKGVVIPICVKVGDKVLLPEYGGTKVQTEDEKEYHLFRESDILAKLDS